MRCSERRRAVAVAISALVAAVAELGRWADMMERGSETHGRQATTSADD